MSFVELRMTFTNKNMPIFFEKMWTLSAELQTVSETIEGLSRSNFHLAGSGLSCQTGCESRLKALACDNEELEAEWPVLVPQLRTARKVNRLHHNSFGAVNP